jgi:hypothetical protein
MDTWIDAYVRPMCRRGSLATQFLRRTGTVMPEDLGMCEGMPERFFFPESEQEGLLLAWLAYRGYSPDELRDRSVGSLRELCTDDMLRNANTPSFARFAFRPELASRQFLTLWLSWYGLHPKESARRGTLEDQVLLLQEAALGSGEEQEEGAVATRLGRRLCGLRTLREFLGRTGGHMDAFDRARLRDAPTASSGVGPGGRAPEKESRLQTAKRFLAGTLDSDYIAEPLIVIGREVALRYDRKDLASAVQDNQRLVRSGMRALVHKAPEGFHKEVFRKMVQIVVPALIGGSTRRE